MTFLFLSLGQKFPKSREVSLEGTVHFSGTVAGPADPLCTGLTTYIKVRMNYCLITYNTDSSVYFPNVHSAHSCSASFIVFKMYTFAALLPYTRFDIIRMLCGPTLGAGLLIC